MSKIAQSLSNELSQTICQMWELSISPSNLAAFLIKTTNQTRIWQRPLRFPHPLKTKLLRTKITKAEFGIFLIHCLCVSLGCESWVLNVFGFVLCIVNFVLFNFCTNWMFGLPWLAQRWMLLSSKQFSLLIDKLYSCVLGLHPSN